MAAPKVTLERDDDDFHLAFVKCHSSWRRCCRTSALHLDDVLPVTRDNEPLSITQYIAAAASCRVFKVFASQVGYILAGAGIIKFAAATSWRRAIHVKVCWSHTLVPSDWKILFYAQSALDAYAQETNTKIGYQIQSLMLPYYQVVG